MSEKRKRNFACLLYEDSAPENFIDIISSWHVPAFLSPYHDRDTWTLEDEKKNPEHKAGDKKKAHWHLMVMFEGLQNPDTVKDMFSEVNGVGFLVVKSIRGYARYLCHLDEDELEKVHYDTDFIKSFAGASYDDCITLDTDRVRVIAEIQSFCIDNDITSYAELLDYCSVYKYSWYRMLITSCSLPMMYYLKSRQWEKEKQYKRKDNYFEEGGQE